MCVCMFFFLIRKFLGIGVATFFDGVAETCVTKSIA